MNCRENILATLSKKIHFDTPCFHWYFKERWLHTGNEKNVVEATVIKISLVHFPMFEVLVLVLSKIFLLYHIQMVSTNKGWPRFVLIWTENFTLVHLQSLTSLPQTVTKFVLFIAFIWSWAWSCNSVRFTLFSCGLVRLVNVNMLATSSLCWSSGEFFRNDFVNFFPPPKGVCKIATYGGNDEWWGRAGPRVFDGLVAMSSLWQLFSQYESVPDKLNKNQILH